MRRFGWIALALVAMGAPAQAQVIIEEAPGSQGASMEPTFFLNTETARILPGGLQYVSIAGGSSFTRNDVSLGFNRGMGAGGELQVTASGLWATTLYRAPGSPATSTTFHPNFALGYKQRVAVLGGWDAALNGKAFYQSPSNLPSYGFQVSLPFTTLLGPGDLTLEPRALLPDLAYGAEAGTYDLTAGYRLPIGERWRLLFQAAGGYSSTQPSGQPTYGWRLGVRYMPFPILDFDASVGYDSWRLDADAARPEDSELANLAVRFGF